MSIKYPFIKKGVAEKLKKQSGYALDDTKMEFIKNKVNDVIITLRAALSKNNAVGDMLSEHNSEYNKDLFIEVQKILMSIDDQLKIINNSIGEIESKKSELLGIIKILSERLESLADEFAEIKREIKDDTLDADGYVILTAELEKVKDRLKNLNDAMSSRVKIEETFVKASRQRNDVLLEMYDAYKHETEAINSSQDEIKIEITFKGEREGFKNQIKSDFRGTGISDTKYQIISEKFTDYVALIEDWILHDGEQLRGIVSPSEYGKLDSKLQEQYSYLIRQQVQNKVEIFYHNKLLKQHSIGQRASALILFILMQDNNDIIKNTHRNSLIV